MLVPITVLLTFQLIGEVIAQALRLPIPGPVVGMGLFFAALALPRVPAERLRSTTTTAGYDRPTSCRSSSATAGATASICRSARGRR